MTLRHCLLLLPLVAAPSTGIGWGADGHTLILEAALNNLPPEVNSVYMDKWDAFNRVAGGVDRYSRIPREGCKHYLDIEKIDASYLRQLRKALHKIYGREGYADEDAKFVGWQVDDSFFPHQVPPWPHSKTDRLWKQLPPDLPSFRQRYGDVEVFIGTVVYQPALHTRALARALATTSSSRIYTSAANLAHYVADMHVPLHLTANYKGQYSDNLSGSAGRSRGRHDVHARFESGFIKSRMKDLAHTVAASMRPARIVDPGEITPAAMAAARAGYEMAAEILSADMQAVKQHDPRRSWKHYVKAVSPTFHPIATNRLAAAAIMLSDLILTAHDIASQGETKATKE